MGSKERRERERRELRAAIVGAAEEIVSAEGWAALTIRRVADAVEYSPPVLYEYFISKEAILHELVGRGFEKLLARMQAVAVPESAEERMVSLALAYCDFAMSDQELYRLMHGMPGSGASTTPPAALISVRQLLFTTVREVLPQLGDADREAAAATHWATLHGLIVLTMAARMPGGADNLAKLVAQSVRAWIAGWRYLASP